MTDEDFDDFDTEHQSIGRDLFQRGYSIDYCENASQQYGWEQARDEQLIED